MRSKILLVCVICFFLMPVSSFARNSSDGRTGANKKEQLEKEILRLEEVGRQKILSGDNNWDDLIAEGAYMIAFDGSIILYQKGLAFPPMTVKAFNMSEMIARSYGEVVVVTGLAEVESETPDKKPFSFKMRFLNVWKKTGDSWKIVVSERTGVRPPAK